MSLPIPRHRPRGGRPRARREPIGRPVRSAGRFQLTLAITGVAAALAQAGCSGHDSSSVSVTARATSCPPLRATSVTPDARFDNLFRSYGDRNILEPHWSGSDGTWSVRLPDGQTLWNMGDTFIGSVFPPDAAHPTWWRTSPAAPGSNSWFIRNSGLLQLPPAQGGWLTTTLYRLSPRGSIASWLEEPAPGLRYGPGAAVVEPAAPGSSTQVLRLFDVVISDKDRRHYPFGFDASSVVVTYGLRDLLRPVSIVTLPNGPGRDPAHRVFFGFAAVPSGAFTYVFGGTANARGMGAYLARYRTGDAGDVSAWQYWDGVSWTPDLQVAQPILPYGPGPTGVSPGYSVGKWGSTYVLFTMGYENRAVIGPIVSYWACSPVGPWRGPYHVYQPPQAVAGGPTGHMLAYYPHVHPEWTDGAGVLLSYDLNDFLPGAAARVIEADVNLYRPHFIRVRLGPVREAARPRPRPVSPGGRAPG